MTSIKATCPDCGEVELGPGDISLMICNHAEASYYSFICPQCTVIVRKPALKETVRLLLSGGVEPTVWELPAELFEPHIGPPISYDDLLDFVLNLEHLHEHLNTGVDPAGQHG